MQDKEALEKRAEVTKITLLVIYPTGKKCS